ncbi:MAG: hypothetical protein K2Q01_06315 [Rickettsiales bacterium]|nr:hypothetical protein [Rickettsiales bacterium]
MSDIPEGPAKEAPIPTEKELRFKQMLAEITGTMTPEEKQTMTQSGPIGAFGAILRRFLLNSNVPEAKVNETFNNLPAHLRTDRLGK